MLENYCATYKKTNTKFGCPLIFEYIKSKKPPRVETNKIRYILYMGRCECGCGGKVSKKHMCVRSACGQKPQSATCVRATEKSSHSNTLVFGVLGNRSKDMKEKKTEECRY